MRYVPLLKAKQGEFRALANLAAATRNSILPLLEHPPLEGYGEDAPEPPEVDTQLERLPAKIQRAWSPGLPLLLDLGLVEDDAALGAGEHPINYVFGRLRELGIEAIPVTALARNDEHRRAVAEAVALDGRGACMRIIAEDLDDPEQAIDAALELLADSNIEVDETDLLLDLGELGQNVGPNVLVVDVALRDLREREQWRSVTLAATSVPDVSGYGPDSVNLARRLEWELWQRVLARDLPRSPDFGDYGIFGAQAAGPVSEFAFAPSPNIRYTTDEEWLILKAKSAIRHGYEQFNQLCRDLVARTEYAGEDFSWGDGYIARCAADEDGPGNASTWIQVNTNHHITAVAEQLASLDAP
jgi:hypothetical protein